MKKIVLFLLIVQASMAQNVLKEFENTISEEDLKGHLTIISSDAMEGRDTGSEGQKKAAAYIIEQLKNYGLKPASKDSAGNSSYLQSFNLYKSGWKESYIKVNGTKKIFFRDYYPNGLVNIPEEKTVLTVFLGYGMEQDFKKNDVKDKVVIYLEGSENKSAEFEGSNGSRKKARMAYDNGAICVFEVSTADDDRFNSLNAERKAVLSRFSRMEFKNTTSENPTREPQFIISKNMAAEILGLSHKKFKKILLGKTVKTKSSSISLKSARGKDVIATANIAALIEGSDKKDEIVVVSAHYDHIGIDDKGNINNGADDDGSGTCAVLEIAEAMAKAKAAGNGPRRTVLFLWVTGEEKGLLGSQYYTDMAPLFPLSQTVCDLNIDMIGRTDKEHANDANYVYLIGSDKLSSELHAISENANKSSVNFTLDYTFNDPNDPNKFYYRSDHYNFAKNKIPVVFYFTGVHADYHRPGDDVEKILFPKYAKITKLVFNTLWEVANREQKLIIDSNKP